MWGELHESKSVSLHLPRIWSAGEGNIIFKKLGATLFYDVYSFEAEAFDEWQSETLAGVQQYLVSVESDAFDNFDKIELEYLLASRPSSDIDKFLSLVAQLKKEFDGRVYYNGVESSLDEIRSDFVACVDYLMKEWAEEPGSRGLAIMIHENYQ
jgi:hypothetical protein